MQQRRRYKSSLFLSAFLILVLAGVGSVSVTSPAKAADEKDPDREVMMEITRGMVCLCGCGNQILANCTCGNAEKERNHILSLVRMGKSKKEIIDMMVKKKGHQVLAAPEKKGLNWVLWVVVPYILPVVALVIVGYLLVSWSRRKPKLPPASAESTETDAEREEYLKKLEDELDKFS